MKRYNQSSKVLVIGGSGFIGTQVVKYLLGRSYQVTIFDKVLSAKYPNICIVGNVCDFDVLSKAINDCEIIVNLAAEHRDDVDPISLYYEVNVAGMANILNAAQLSNVNRIIFTSTVAVYPLGLNNPDENNTPKPFNHYGESKYQAENLLLKWSEQLGRSCLILRPCVVIGKGNRGNVHNLIKQIKSGYFLMVGSGENRKSMCYVGNIANLIAQKLEDEETELLNFADKPDLTSNEIIKQIRDGLNTPQSIFSKVRVPYWLGLMGGFLFDIIAKLLGRSLPISSVRVKKFTANTTISTKRLIASGYEPSFSLSNGLSEMINNHNDL